MMQNRNRLFGYHFERVQHFKKNVFFSGIMVFDSAYIYGAYFIATFQWVSGFLTGVWGFHGPPLKLLII